MSLCSAVTLIFFVIVALVVVIGFIQVAIDRYAQRHPENVAFINAMILLTIMLVVLGSWGFFTFVGL